MMLEVFWLVGLASAYQLLTNARVCGSGSCLTIGFR